MTKQEEIYYYYSAEARTVLWSAAQIEENEERRFLGSSDNPKKIMAATAFTQAKNIPVGWQLMELID